MEGCGKCLFCTVIISQEDVQLSCGGSSKIRHKSSQKAQDVDEA